MIEQAGLDRAAASRLYLRPPAAWSAEEALEARNCSGCIARVDEDGEPYVEVIPDCPSHGRSL